MKMTIPSARTAMARKTLSRPMRDLHNTYPMGIRDSLLDYGCGRGDDVKHLRAEGFNAFGYDPNWNPWADSLLLGGQYNIVTCLYVLNVIEDRHEELRIFDELRRLVTPGGLVFVAARNWGDVLKVAAKGTKEGRGYRTASGTWQRGVMPHMVEGDGLRAGLDPIQSFGGTKYTGVLFRG